MRKGYLPTWFAAILLTLLLLWKMLGAPLTALQFQALETPLWQARVLLPSRVSRVLMLWMPIQLAHGPAQTLPEDGLDVDERELSRITNRDEQKLMVYVAQENRLTEMTLEGYVCGVVAAEMPAAYHLEALKAQAVAARTRALFQLENGGCDQHTGADICTDSAHCQAYANLESCRNKWGEEYSVYRERILKAAQETRDELLTYAGEPITVMYHAISGGKTEASQAVFSESLPYLVSVDSAGEESAKGFYTDTSYTFEEAAAMLSAEMPELRATADGLRKSFLIGGYTPTGRIQSLLIGDQVVSATVFRRALKLRSTWFTFSTDAAGITFHQRGYGHGVGMSQVGANSMAAEGSDYCKILAHYYPNTLLEKQ